MQDPAVCMQQDQAVQHGCCRIRTKLTCPVQAASSCGPVVSWTIVPTALGRAVDASVGAVCQCRLVWAHLPKHFGQGALLCSLCSSNFE